MLSALLGLNHDNADGLPRLDQLVHRSDLAQREPPSNPGLEHGPLQHGHNRASMEAAAQADIFDFKNPMRSVASPPLNPPVTNAEKTCTVPLNPSSVRKM